MGKVPVQFRKRKQRTPLKHARREDILADKFENEDGPIDRQHLLISALLPYSVKAFLQECEKEVEQLCGSRYEHGKVNQRWGTQKGSIILANQHIAVEKPRVRSKGGSEVELQTFVYVGTTAARSRQGSVSDDERTDSKSSPTAALHRSKNTSCVDLERCSRRHSSRTL